MQLQTIIIAALAAVAAAMPHEENDKKHGHGGDHHDGGHGHGKECKPATYQCSEEHGKPSWDVCNTSGKWEVSYSPSPFQPPSPCSFTCLTYTILSLPSTASRTPSALAQQRSAAPGVSRQTNRQTVRRLLPPQDQVPLQRQERVPLLHLSTLPSLRPLDDSANIVKQRKHGGARMPWGWFLDTWDGLQLA